MEMTEKKIRLEKVAALEEAELVAEQRKHGINVKQPKSLLSPQLYADAPQPDHMKWSIGSLFICLCWGVLAFMASNKVRRFNEVRNYNEAARYSRIAYRHNISAVACFVVLICILAVPWAIALAVQGDIRNYASVREFFG